jgi:hypothetical protein
MALAAGCGGVDSFEISLGAIQRHGVSMRLRNIFRGVQHALRLPMIQESLK